jgi:hypothetical protein
MVKTRTVVQTRTHAQKYFQKLAKSTGSDDGFGPHDRFFERKLPSIASTTSKRARIVENTPMVVTSAIKLQSADAANKFYFPLESDSLKPFDRLSTPTISTFPNLFLPPPPQTDFPQPSPAACGRRKHMELNAAHILASGGSSQKMDMEGAKLLSKMKDQSIERSVDSGRRFRSTDLSLSIINPQGLLLTDSNEPGTPWDKQISALKETKFTDIAPPVAFFSDPGQYLCELRSLVAARDVNGIADQLRRIHDQDDMLGLVLNLTGQEGDRTFLMDTIDSVVNGGDVFEIVKLLLEYGASPSTCDSSGNTALLLSAELGLDRIGELLLTKGASINQANRDGNAAVHFAAMEGHVPFLQMLARLGANFHLHNGSAFGPLDLAGSRSANPGEREVVRRAMLFAEPRLRTLVLYHQDFLDHTARRPSDWEGPDRLKCIMGKLNNRQLFPDYNIEISSHFDKADVELLGRVHCAEYLTFVNDLSKQVQGGEEGVFRAPVPFTPQVQRHVMHQSSEELKRDENCDTSFSAGTLNAARRAAGAVAHAVDRVMLGRNRNAFCAIRPPGHHAGYRGLLDGADSCGFCIFNNVAAGALHALTDHQCERVAIIDFDVHHGEWIYPSTRKLPLLFVIRKWNRRHCSSF